MQAALHGGAAIWRPSIAFECARAAMLLIRARAVVDVASDGTSNSATRRDEIFIVRVRDCGHPAALRLSSLDKRC
jgi:hypothetical protein